MGAEAIRQHAADDGQTLLSELAQSQRGTHRRGGQTDVAHEMHRDQRHQHRKAQHHEEGVDQQGMQARAAQMLAAGRL